MRNRPLRSSPFWVVLVAAWPMWTAGCLDPSTRLNAPPQGSTERPNQMQDQYVYMTDNGMMYDMCVSDIHFIPHTSSLSGLGVRRLNRYAELLEGYGGSVHLDTICDDETLNQARLQSINTHLASAGLNMNNVKVERGTAQGRGFDAPTALRVMAEGTVDDTKAGGGGAAKSGASGSSK